MARSTVSSLAALGLLAIVGAARAAPPPEADRPARATPPREREQALRHITVTVNPLALLVGRYGGNVEILPARHHAIVVSGYLQTFSFGMLRSLVPEYEDRLRDAKVSSAGGEIGYRFYSGRSGAEGLFFGPSFVVTPLAYPRLARDELAVELAPFHAVGGAVDIGAQAVTSWGLTVGGGAGLMALAYDLPEDARRLPIEIAPRIFPRLLFTAGWSF